MSVADPHRSIGDVLNELRPDFPDVTISKIRFLESQGLIAPERTPSGYRKFAPNDVERLRWVLGQQRDHFLPLKVIKERLSELDDGQLTLDELLAGHTPSREAAVKALFERARADQLDESAQHAVDVGLSAHGGRFDHGAASNDDTGALTGISLTRSELATAAGIDDQMLSELEGYGLVVAMIDGDRPLFGDEALTIARTARLFNEHGIEPRHLRMYKAFAERELTLFEQVVAPYRRQRNPEANERADATRTELAALGRMLRASLLQQSVRHVTS